MTSNVKHIDVVTSVPVTSGDATSASTTFGHETNKTTTSSHITCTSTSGATTSDHVTTAATTSAHVTSKATTSAHVTSVATASSHVTNKATTSSHVTTAATSSAHVTTAATASAHVTSVVTASTLVTSKPKTSAHVTSAATASAHVTSAATASAHVTSVATALAHVTATVPTLVTSKPTSTHVTSVATTVAHVTSVAAASAHVISATAVQASVVTSPAVACGTHQLSNAPGGTHQLYQVVPVVQNGVPCRLLVPLNMVPSVTKVVTTGGKVQTADQPAASVSSRLPAGNSKFVLQQVKVASQPCTAAGNSAVVHVLSPAGSAAVAGETGKDGKVSGSVVPGAVISSPAGVSGAAGPGAVMSSPVGHSATSTVQKVIAMTPTIAPGSKLVPAAPVTSPGKPPPSAVIQVPASSVASPAAVYNIIKVTPPPPGGTLTIGPNTRLVVVSGSSTGVTQSLGPRTSAAVGNVAVVTPTVKAATSAKSSVLKTQACTLPVGRPMVTTSAGQHKIVFVPQTSTGTAQSSARVVPQTSRPATAQPAAQILPNKPSAAPKQVSMVQQNENVVLINGQPYKLIPCPTTTHIPVDALKSTAAATVSSAVAQTAAPGPVTVTSAVAQTAAPARQTQVTASNSTAGGVTSAWEGSPRTEETGSGSETESASPVRSEPGEGTVLKIDSVYSLKGASKAPGSPTCKDALASKTIAQASSAANTLKNIASIHSAVVNTPKKYIVVYPNKPATPPSPPCAVKQASVAQTATKPSEPADTKPGTPPASPVKVPANKTSPRQPAPDRTPAKQLDPKPADKTPTKQLAPKSVTEMYHSYAKAETPDVPIPQMKRSVTALMVRTTPLGKSNGTVAMGQDNPEPATLPPSKIFRLEPPRPNETIQDERVRRLKEILREREAAVEELRRRKKP